MIADKKNYIPPASGVEYELTELPNGNVQLKDVTVYEQIGDTFGATDWNELISSSISEYTCSGNSLTGNGANGKFKATAGGTYTAFTIDGQSYSVKSGGENEVELTAGVWYTFVLDVQDKTINFKSGGAGLNFKIVGGTTRPQNPRENTIWINTDTAIGEYQFSSTKPKTKADGSGLQKGDVWIATQDESLVFLNVLKKQAVILRLGKVLQYIDSDFELKAGKIYQSGQWKDIESSLILIDDGNLLTEETGGVTLINFQSTAKELHEGFNSLKAYTKSNYTGYGTLYFNLPIDLTSVSKITVKFCTNSTYFPIGFGVSANKTTQWNNMSTKLAPYGTEVLSSPNYALTTMNSYSLDTSNLTGSYYIGVGGVSNGNAALAIYINSVVLE